MAREMMDIALDADQDLKIIGGDFAVEESTNAHQRALLLSTKGDYKQNPTVGVGLVTFIDDEGANNVMRAVALEFVRDGMDAKNMKVDDRGITDSTITIFPNAKYQ
jgi:hypothetical protein